MMEMLDLNEQEMKFVCLYHNGRESVVDYFAYLQTLETSGNVKGQIQKLKTSILATYPKYFKLYPTELERICGEMKEIESLIASAGQEMFTTLEFVLSLGEFIVDAVDKKYFYLDYIGDQSDWCDWQECWDEYSRNIVKILTYLNSVCYFDDRKFYQKRIEVEFILFREMKNILYLHYSDCLNRHYGLTENRRVPSPDSGRYMSKMSFVMQYDYDKLDSKQNLWWFDSKQFSVLTLGLSSDTCNKLSQCVNNVFYDRLGDFNSQRYAVSLYLIEDIEDVKVQGTNPHKDSSFYDCFLKAKPGKVIPSHFDRTGDEGGFSSDGEQFIRNAVKGSIKNAITEIMGINNPSVGFTGWYREDNDEQLIASHLFIARPREERVKWEINELYALDKCIRKAIKDYDSQQDLLSVKSIRPYFHVRTGKVNFNFQLHCFSPGLKDILFGIIGEAQEIILGIQPY